MNTRKFAICTIVASLLALAGCATSPEDEQRRLDMEADIDDILSHELDVSEFGERKKCLADHEYRSFRALGNRHLLFEGRNDKQWVNVLRGKCHRLDDNSKFVMRQGVSGRSCDRDRFEAVDRLDPVSGGMGSTCMLGEFRPVTKAQVTEIEDRLEMR